MAVKIKIRRKPAEDAKQRRVQVLLDSFAQGGVPTIVVSDGEKTLVIPVSADTLSNPEQLKAYMPRVMELWSQS